MKFFRVDERLIHGQVLSKWLAHLRCKRVLIIDDQICEDPITRKVLLMALPKEVSLKFYNVKEGTKIVEAEETAEAVMVLFKDLNALCQAVESGLQVDAVNIARLPYEEGKSELLEHIYISEEECVFLKELIRKGVRLAVQMVPDSTPVYLNEMI